MTLSGPWFVYGLFEPSGICAYIGHTGRLTARRGEHRQRFPHLQFIVIRQINTRLLAQALERVHMQAMQDLGECYHNKNQSLKLVTYSPKTLMA